MRRVLLAAVAVLALNSVARATEEPLSLLETMNGDWAIDNAFNCSVPSKAFQVFVSDNERLEWKDALQSYVTFCNAYINGWDDARFAFLQGRHGSSQGAALCT
jgi:hypothetical protein